ncbi:hypothetical protein ACWERV_02425 [Streptomyces sp. NPDC004031]
MPSPPRSLPPASAGSSGPPRPSGKPARSDPARPDPARAPAPSASRGAPLRPPARLSADGSGRGVHAQHRAYEDRPRQRRYDHGFREQAPSLLPGAGSTGPGPTATTLPAPAAVQSDPPPATTRKPRVLRVLPLGAGMMLVGLGLGFLGLRLRRT